MEHVKRFMLLGVHVCVVCVCDSGGGGGEEGGGGKIEVWVKEWERVCLVSHCTCFYYILGCVMFVLES